MVPRDKDGEGPSAAHRTDGHEAKPPHIGESDPGAAGLPGGAPGASGPDGAELTGFRKWMRASVGQWALRVSILLLALLLAGAAGLVIFVARLSGDLPSVEQLKTGYAPPQVTRVRARDGTLLANVFRERRTVIPFSEIPDVAKLAFLAAEDAGFYEHEGLDYFGMMRAVVANLRAGGTRQGGSTITQQVVKNVLLDAERTYKRKVRETILARRLEQHLTKDEILGLYLNHIYLGHGRYGVEEAARYYFGKKAKALDLAEASLLAGIVAAPERFSPRNHPERALDRRAYVLSQMKAKGFLPAPAAERIKTAPIRLAPQVEAESELSPESVAHGLRALRQVAGEAADRGGYEVTTTIDPRLQAAARSAVRSALDEYAKRQKLEAPFTETSRALWGPPTSGRPKPSRIHVGVVESTDDRFGTVDVKVGDVTGRIFLGRETRYNPKGLSPSEFTRPGAVLRVAILGEADAEGKPPLRLELGPQGALVALDVRTRDVVALVGSYEALAGGLDRATNARRQPGSAFKPVTFAYALHARHITPAAVLELPGQPASAGPRKIDVRTALAKSDNAAAEHVLRLSGADNVVAFAHALGIESHLGADLSLALGSYEVTPLELANAYVTFANGGIAGPPRLVAEIRSASGAAVMLPPLPPSRRVMAAEEAYLATSLMRSVVESGTGQQARRLGRPLAGKTGTTNDSRDTWFVGFSTDYVVAVWVGWDDSLSLGKRESGAKTALPAWIEFMKAAHEGRPVADFVRPGNIVLAAIDPATGLLARDGASSLREEEFLDGTAPTELAPEATPDGGTGDAGTPAVASPVVPVEHPLPGDPPPF